MCLPHIQYNFVFLLLFLFSLSFYTHSNLCLKMSPWVILWTFRVLSPVSIHFMVNDSKNSSCRIYMCHTVCNFRGAARQSSLLPKSSKRCLLKRMKMWKLRTLHPLSRKSMVHCSLWLQVFEWLFTLFLYYDFHSCLSGPPCSCGCKKTEPL